MAQKKKASNKKKKVAKKAPKKIKKAAKTVAKKTAKKAVKKVAKKTAKKAPAKKTAAKKTAKKKSKAPKLKVSGSQELSSEMIAHVKRWQKLHKQNEDEPVLNYNIRNSYEVKNVINHKLFGWGLVVSKRDNFIEVVFESGVKKLISEYKG